LGGHNDDLPVVVVFRVYGDALYPANSSRQNTSVLDEIKKKRPVSSYVFAGLPALLTCIVPITSKYSSVDATTTAPLLGPETLATKVKNAMPCTKTRLAAPASAPGFPSPPVVPQVVTTSQ
jgi:hypothetical protein